MKPVVFIAGGMALVGALVFEQGYLDVLWPSGEAGLQAATSASVVQPAASQQQEAADTLEQVAQAQPQSAGGSTQAPGPGQPPQVDETALRYFSAKGDTKRLEAEIARLRALYPEWTPPENPLAVRNEGDPQLDEMWKLYSDGKLADVRKAIADRQTAQPGWQPPADLLDRLAVAEAREQLVNASDLKQYDAVIRVGSLHPSLLTCGDVDVLWRVADAFANTDRKDRARDAYLYILKTCEKPEERLATVQKALPLLPRADLDQLLALERTGQDGKGEFEPVRDDIARQSLANADADPNLVVAQADIDRVKKLADANGPATDDLMLGWYYVRRDDPQSAEQWFSKARAKEDSAAASQGLALALVDQNRPAEAEEALYKWRESSDDTRKVYMAAVANLLAVTPPPPIEPAVLQRMAQAVAGEKDAAAAQQFGWYADSLNQPQTAAQWFSLALQWKPDDEPSAYGLALSRWKLGDKAGVAEIQTAWAGRSERIPTVGERSVETAAVDTRDHGQQPAVQPAQAPSVTEPAPRAQPSPAPRGGSAGTAAGQGGGCSTTMDPSVLAPESALTRGWCLMGANRPMEAAAAFEVALRGSGKTRSDAAYGQSLAYMRAGLTDMAAVSATKAPIDSDRSVELRISLLDQQANAAFQQRRYMETLMALDERSRLAPEVVGLMVLRGYAYLGLKRFADAEQVFRAAAATGSRDALRGLNDVQTARNPQN